MDSSNRFIDELINSVNIAIIDPKTNFWMVRTKKGFFFEEFIEEGFIGLGWNIITQNQILNVLNQPNRKSEKLAKATLIKRLEEKYPKNKLPMQSLNKCIRFFNEIKNGDIIMIPSRENEEIAFAEVGDYYEDVDCSYEKETEIISRIDSGESYGYEEECPYRKRRRINVLKVVKGDDLNINLYKALASVHGLSEINKYANFVLSSIYNLYYWDKKISMVFDIEREEEIDTFDLSSFMYNASMISRAFDDNVKTSTKVNLNSAGQLILNFFQQHGKEINDFLQQYKTPITLIWISIFGGTFGKTTVNSILDHIMKFREQNSNLKDAELERELKKIQIEKEKLNLIKEKQILECSERIHEASNGLMIKKSEANNIININDYFHGNNN